MSSFDALSSGVLDIGRLGTDLDGVVEYYTAGVAEGEDASIPPASADATAAEKTLNYYVGNAANSGRWVGSLRERLAVEGSVDPEQFRRLLEGRHPITAEPLTPGALQAAAKREKRLRRKTTKSAEFMSVAEVAQRLDLSPRHVRRLLEQGAALDDKARAETWSYLTGVKAAKNFNGPGRGKWRIPAADVERFATERTANAVRPGFDLTLRPPKSVSVLWALGKPEWSAKIADAHREAVDQVIDYYENDATFSRKRVEGEQLRILADGMIGAAFDHRTSRAGDPLLHTHVVVFNATQCVDGQWRSLDGTTIYEHAKTGGYLYQAHLRHILARDLGVRWTDVTNGCAEIEGIPRQVIDLFSKRREEIESAVADSGYSSAAAHQTATLSTRRPKGHEPEPPVAVERWWTEAKTIGFTPGDLSECVESPGHQRMVLPEQLANESERLLGPDGVTLMMSTFARRDLIQALSEFTNDACSALELRAAASDAVAHSDVVRLNAGGKDSDLVLEAGDIGIHAPSVTRFSTSELLAKETDVLRWAESAFDGDGATARTDIVEAALERHHELTPEQIAMVRSITRNGYRLHLVVGDPGSGKTHAMNVAVEALTRAGVPVVGAALSADAAAELESSIDLRSQTGRATSTIALLLNDLENQPDARLPNEAVVVLDEASMVGTRMFHRLLEYVEAAAGSVVMLGDPNQHGSVETGGVYRHLVKKHSDRVVRLASNNRQTEEADRAAIAEYRAGKVRNAVDTYEDAGGVVRSKSLTESYDAMVLDWFDDFCKGGASPMLAGRNAMRAELNRRARRQLDEAGILSGKGLMFGEKEFRAGDLVVARKNKRRLQSNDGQHVKNGSTGVVASVNDKKRSIAVRFDREGTIELPSWYLDAGLLDYGYARTTYGVQGKTLEHVGYQPTDASSFEEGYVAITRGRSGTRLYLVEEPGELRPKPQCSEYDSAAQLDDELIVRALNKRRAKLMATDIDRSDAAEFELEW